MVSKASQISAFAATANTADLAAAPPIGTAVAAAYTNAIAYAASNTYVNATFAQVSETRAVSVTNTFASGNTTITGSANISGAIQVGGSATISGNLYVNGTTVSVNTSQVNVTDSLLYLADGNESSDTLDIGFAGHYNNGAGANGHTGLIRSAITKKYYLFQNYQPEFFANNNVDVANTGTGIQMADLVVGGLTANTFTANNSKGSAGQVLTSAGSSANAYWANNTPPFPSGTAMLFVQTNAPTGWTKQTTHDNKALRVVSGTAGSGGTSAFTSVFGSRVPSGSVTVSGSVGSTTLTTAQMPSHYHDGYSNLNLQYSGGGGRANDAPNGQASSGRYWATLNAGGGGSHDHTFSGSGSLSMASMDFNVQYVDTIIATKD